MCTTDQKGTKIYVSGGKQFVYGGGKFHYCLFTVSELEGKNTKKKGNNFLCSRQLQQLENFSIAQCVPTLQP